jgi:serine/threonine kinase 16
MIDDDGQNPILMDLGSLAPSPTPITSRSLALQVQDTAAEHSTMPYRAPGCMPYACLVGKSPFEARSDETGGSLSMCVLGGDWRFPDEGRGAKPAKDGEGISEGVKEVVRKCLKVEPGERPDVDQLIDMVEGVIAGLPQDGSE